MIVADGRCATVSWVPITQHTESTTVCAGTDGALSVPRLVTDESIAGTTTTSTVRCPATAYLLPPAARPDERWGATCSLTSPAEKVSLAGVALGPATIVVGGHDVSVRAHPAHPDLHRERRRDQPDGLLDRPEQRPHRARARDRRRDPGWRPLLREHGRRSHRARPGALTGPGAGGAATRAASRLGAVRQ